MRNPFGGGRRRNPFKLPEPPRAKNLFEIDRNRQLAIEALRSQVCISFTYEALPRVAEVHTVGRTRAGRPAMSVYQVDGQSKEPPVRDWKLFCFDECFNVALTDLPSSAPRANYKKGSKQFRSIDAEL